MAVVAPDNLKVRGMENLRIADASIMPYLVSGNTNAGSLISNSRETISTLIFSGTGTLNVDV